MKNAGPSEQRYGTPWHIVRALEHEMRRTFLLDVCAEAWSSKARTYINERINGLKAAWSPFNWCNPPYNDQAAWIEKAIIESARRDAFTALLVKASVDAHYFRPSTWEVGTVDLYEGRISFIAPPEGVWKGKGKARRFIAGGQPVDGSDFASALVLIGPGARRHTLRWRDAKTGVIISPARISA